MRTILAVVAVTGVPALLPAQWSSAAHGQSMGIEDATLADRPISKILFKGLQRVSEREVLNNTRVTVGQPFEAVAVRNDVATLYRLGQFDTVDAVATLLPDGSVELSFVLVEQPIVKDLQVVGNKLISDQELRKAIPLYAGGPRDDFLLEQAVTRIKELYRKRGHYLAEVTVDETRLQDTGILILRVVEGPRVKVKELLFVGNENFPADELSAEIGTRTSAPLFIKGELDEDRLIDDVAALDKFYKARGFVDVRIDRRIEISPDSKEAKISFVISEGRRYRLRAVVIEGMGVEGPKPLELFEHQQIRDLLYIHAGDIYSRLKLDKSIASVRDAYYILGHVDARITDRTVRVGEQAEVDLVLSIREGPRTITGLVNVQGNFLTKDKIIRRLVRIQPGRVLDGRELDRSEARVKGSQIFNEVRITVQRANPAEQDALDNADALAAAAAVKAAEDAARASGTTIPPTTTTATDAAPSESERRTGEIRSAMVRSEVRDVLVEIKERNTGSVNFGVGLGTDSGVFGELSVNQRNFDIADPPETFSELIAGRAYRGAGQQFSATISPGVDVSVSMFVERTDVDTQFRPSRGSTAELRVTQVASLDEVDPFTVVRAGYTQFFTVSEDFLGRRATLRIKTDAAYIFGDSAPVYERFYMGGRNFRGFEYRTVSPKATESWKIDPLTGLPYPSDDPIGGTWLFFAGAQYEKPIFQNAFSSVLFIDSGTVNDEVGFDEYRVSVGIGVRLYIPQFGPAPLAFDFAYPILKLESDETQTFSFSAEIPF